MRKRRYSGQSGGFEALGNVVSNVVAKLGKKRRKVQVLPAQVSGRETPKEGRRTREEKPAVQVEPAIGR